MPGIPYPTTTNTIQAGTYEPGTAGNDRILTANVSNTFINGGDGDDYITLINWNLTTDAGAGNDVIEIFNTCNVTGGAGSDYFVFDGTKWNGAAYDYVSTSVWSTIADYTDGFDKIAILNNTGGVTGFSNLILTQVGANVEISFPQTAPRIVLQNVALSSLDASDFIFGDGSGGGTGGGTVGIPYPTTTTTIQAATYEPGTAGNDRILTVNVSNTFINGGDGDDYITLINWNLTTDAGAGNDVIEIFNTCNVTGGAGSDYFVFDGTKWNGAAYDYVSTSVWSTIADYTDGFDKIAILNNTGGVTGFSNLILTQVGANVEISFPQTAPRIVLQNVALSSLDASDFIFGDGSGGGGTTGSIITGTAAAETLTGTANNDTITGLGGNDALNGGGGNDTFNVSGAGDGFDIIDGGTGTDTVIATAANTTIGLTGLSNVETVSSGGYAGVRIEGTGNADTLNFSSVTLSGITQIDSGAGDDNITGSAAADTLIGGLGNDTLSGVSGDDILDGGAGINQLIGGAGTDFARYNGTKSQYAVSQNANGTYALSGNGSTDTLDSVENVQFSDGTFATSSLVPTAPGTITVSTVAELRAAIHNTAYSTILLTPGTYTVTDHDPATTWGEVGFFIDRNVTIKSAGPGRADIRAGITFSKALFVTAEGSSASVTFDGIGFFDTRGAGNQGSSENYAGIKFQSTSAANLTILNCYFENNYNALKSLSNSGGLFVDNSTFMHNGNLNGSGQEHQIYWEGTTVHVEDSNFSDSGYGHSIKTVASQYTEILRNTIIDGSNGASLINVTGGGALTITGNNITKNTTARSGYVIEYETMRAGNMPGAILIDGNTITSNFQDVIDGSYATLIRNETDSLAVISNNAINGSYSEMWLLGDTQFTNNTINGVLSADQSWRGNADQLTALADTVYFTGTNGNVLPGSYIVQATNAGDGNDTLVASPDYDGRDIFYGGLGDDVLAGGKGDDSLYGGDGNDTLFAGPAIVGNSYGDRLFGGAGADYLGVGPLGSGEVAKVQMDGGAGDDILDGRTSDQTILFGGAGNDTLLGSQTLNDGSWDAFNGGDGDDIVYGGWGYSNYLSGGAGIDTMVYAGAYQTDLSVVWEYGVSLRVEGVTQAGLNEVSGYSERPDKFEYIQFSNGVYNVATRTFTAGQVRISLANLLATPVPAYPGAAQPMILTGTAAAETLTGGAANDTITGLGGDDTLIGNAGNDTFRFTGTADGFDSVDGGAGNDTITATTNNAVIGLSALTGVEAITAGSFTGVSIAGSSAANTLDFTNGTLTGITKIDGGAGNDSITGSAGNDTILGSAGDDALMGGAGNDTFQFSGTAGGFDAVNGGAGTDAIAALANATVIGLSSLTGVETVSAGSFTGVYVQGSATANTLDFSTATLTGITKIDGGAGNDSIIGSAGNDTVLGSAGDDTLSTGGGNDTIQYTGTANGYDAVDGGAGTDTILALANSTVIGLSTLAGVEAISAGTFTGVIVRGSDNADTLDFSAVTLTAITRVEGGAGDDVLTGNAAANTIWGGTGNDRISGGAGNDSLVGDAGADTLIGGAGNDTLNGGADIDTADYSANSLNQTINLTLTTAQTISTGDLDTISNVENVIGGSGVDTIAGSALANVLDGGAGNDRLTGGAGNDTIRGGAGTIDVAIFAGLQASYSITTAGGVVSVTDNQATTDGNDGSDVINGIEKVEFKGGVQVGVTSPIILDLDGRGVTTLTAAQSRAQFDMDGDTVGDDTSWIGSTEGFLFLDRDGNGTLSGVNEMSFAGDVPDAASDLVGLRTFDSDADGRLSATDEQFASFKVWRDADGDGRVDQGEVMSLEQAGVAAINLTGTAVTASTAFGDVAVVNRGSYERTDGSTMAFLDAVLTYVPGAGQGRGNRGVVRGAEMALEQLDSVAELNANGRAQSRLQTAIAALVTHRADAKHGLIAAAAGATSFDQLLEQFTPQGAPSLSGGLRTLDFPRETVPLAGDISPQDSLPLLGADMGLMDTARRLALMRHDTAGFGAATGSAELNLISAATLSTPHWF